MGETFRNPVSIRLIRTEFGALWSFVLPTQNFDEQKIEREKKKMSEFLGFVISYDIRELLGGKSGTGTFNDSDNISRG